LIANFLNRRVPGTGSVRGNDEVHLAPRTG
jgi:hypothetical protein